MQEVKYTSSGYLNKTLQKQCMPIVRSPIMKLYRLYTKKIQLIKQGFLKEHFTFPWCFVD